MIRVLDTNGICECCGKFKPLYVFHFESPNIPYFKILRMCDDCFQIMKATKTQFDHEKKPDDFNGCEEPLVVMSGPNQRGGNP